MLRKCRHLDGVVATVFSNNSKHIYFLETETKEKELKAAQIDEHSHFPHEHTATTM